MLKQIMQIVINGIKVETIIGCEPSEREQTQNVEIDLILELGSWAGVDELKQTVNYADVVNLVKQLVENSQFLLVESLASYLANELLSRYKLLNKVTLSIGKPEIYSQFARDIKAKYEVQRSYKVALALGSNLNYPQQQLVNAIEFLGEIISQIKVAPFYKSAPYGHTQQEDFYNTCISGYTILNPDQLLVQIKKIEKFMGKVEQFQNGPRIIDIDLLLFDDLIYQGLFLQIPHQEMHKRDFVLRPLAQIEPQWLHPQLGLTIGELAANLKEAQFILQQVD